MFRKGLVLLLLFFVLSLFSGLQDTNDISVTNDVDLVIQSQETNDPLRIYSRDDLSSQGWPGGGTEEDPYIIESVHIKTDELPAVLVEGVLHAHLIIRDCMFESSGSGGFLGVLSSSSDIRIQNCTFVCGSSRALEVSDSRNIALIGCSVDGSGIVIDSSNKIDLIENDISDASHSSPDDSYYSVLVMDSRSLKLENNTISQSDTHGFFIITGTNISMLHNNVRSISGWAFYLYDSLDSVIRGNLAEDTVWVPIRVTESYDCIIEDNRVFQSDEWGIAIFQSSYIVLRNNRCNQTRYNSISVVESSNIDVINNICSNTMENGIIVEYSENCNVEGNEIHRSRYQGINIYRSAGCEIVDNNVFNTDNNGLFILDSIACNIYGNLVRGSLESCLYMRNSTEILIDMCYFASGDICGIKVDISQSCNISSCWAVDCNTFGIELEYCQDMQISNCTAARNDGYGITLQHTNTSSILHNKVGLNRLSAFDSSGENDWDSNWWYEYSGSDGGSFQIDSFSIAVDENAIKWNETTPHVEFIGPDYLDIQVDQSTAFLMDAPNAEWYWLFIDNEIIESGWDLEISLIVSLEEVPAGTHNITLKVINVFGYSTAKSVDVTIADTSAIGIVDLDSVISIVLVANGIFQIALVTYIVRESRRLR